jgi:hypothetical protein
LSPLENGGRFLCDCSSTTVAAGRSALVARLRAIASRLEELPLDTAAEVLVLLEPAVARLDRWAELALTPAQA